MTQPKPLAASIPDDLRERLNAAGADLKPASELPTPQERAARRDQETEDERRERLAARFGVFRARWLSQVPPMYQDADWSDLDEAQRFDWPEGSLTLVLAGSVGTGKTHAAYAIGNAFSRRGRWVQAVTVVDLLAALRPDGDPTLAKAVQECDLLILDDLGAGKATDWAVEQLTALMDLRVRQERRTIITTNVPEPDLEAAWGGRFMDRVRFRRTVHVFRGASRRVGAW